MIYFVFIFVSLIVKYLRMSIFLFICLSGLLKGYKYFGGYQIFYPKKERFIWRIDWNFLFEYYFAFSFSKVLFYHYDAYLLNIVYLFVLCIYLLIFV